MLPAVHVIPEVRHADTHRMAYKAYTTTSATKWMIQGQVQSPGLEHRPSQEKPEEPRHSCSQQSGRRAVQEVGQSKEDQADQHGMAAADDDGQRGQERSTEVDLFGEGIDRREQDAGREERDGSQEQRKREAQRQDGGKEDGNSGGNRKDDPNVRQEPPRPMPSQRTGSIGASRSPLARKNSARWRFTSHRAAITASATRKSVRYVPAYLRVKVVCGPVNRPRHRAVACAHDCPLNAS